MRLVANAVLRTEDSGHSGRRHRADRKYNSRSVCVGGREVQGVMEDSLLHLSHVVGLPKTHASSPLARPAEALAVAGGLALYVGLAVCCTAGDDARRWAGRNATRKKRTP